MPGGFRTDAKAGMVPIPGGAFRMGSNRHFPEERPQRRAEVKPFFIDRHEVTNAQFATFIAATGYVTARSSFELMIREAAERDACAIACEPYPYGHPCVKLAWHRAGEACRSSPH